jgi:hypothetical protein
MFRHVLIVFLLLSPVVSHATVSALFVNHITEELHWFEDQPIGIGWEPLGEGDARLAQLEREFIEQGYRLTSFPYKLECCIGALMMFFLIFGGILVKRLWKALNASTNV